VTLYKARNALVVSILVFVLLELTDRLSSKCCCVVFSATSEIWSVPWMI